MSTRRLLLAAALTFLMLGQESRAQQPGYPMAPRMPATNGYPYLPGYATQAAYMGPTAGYPMAPGGPQAVQQDSQGLAQSSEAPANGGNCPPCQECEDYSCRDAGWQCYGEYLYIRPRNAEVPFAVPINGPTDPPPVAPVETGPVALLSPDYHTGYRVGFGRSIDCWTSIGASYTRFDSETLATATAEPRHALRSLVSHPSTLNTAGDFQSATGHYDLSYQLADLNYRCTFARGCRWSADYVIGARYGHMEQYMLTNFSFNGSQEVSTTINFDGAGPMVGLQAERIGANTGFMVYGRGMASFLAGDFSARYRQFDAFGQTLVDTSWKSGRIVPITEIEIGAGWAGPGGLLRFTAGYVISAWFNAVKTADFISSVQRNNFLGLSDAMTFDGLVARAEARF